ncbi:hypothetical protein COU61_01700 [Candidatus Pacearchaeota archaeon CG10_big_fil_rev_8_21_14_0_10_35_13]|nr:MAG: hypothetical protein COU61_01700 [Candidatus Pacearchaeota archaeon CG10_big_fil_rev_8_21_14_0_10_35_13]
MGRQNMFFGGGQYNPKTNGPLERYLETHDGRTSFPLFKGWKHYEMLWDRGYLEPGMSVIRLMWNDGREDEHFLVMGVREIEGMSELQAHAGREGTQDPKRILSEKNCPPWEAHSLNREPTPR